MAGLLDLNNGGDYPGFQGIQNSLVGLGLGLMTGPTLAGALRGYESGAKVDAANQHTASQARLQREHMALQRELANRPPEAARLWAATENNPPMRAALFPKTEDWETRVDEASGLPYQVHKRTGESRAVQLPTAPSSPPVGAQPMPAPSMPPASPVPYTANAPQYAEPPPAAPTAPPRQYGQTPPIMGPQGPISPPPGLFGPALKAWQQHVGGAVGDVSMGKQTEEQARSSLYARQMENAERILSGQGGAGGVENEGTSAYGRGTEAIPFGAGRYMQGNDYQRYSTARDQFINGALRRESGAAIKDSEYTRKEKQLFPQPGDSAQVIEDKRKARLLALDEMRRGAGAGYRPMSEGTVGVQPSSGSKPDPFGLR